MKVALVYDRVNKFGGAERVLLSLHKLFPDAPLFTSVYNPQSASWAKVFTVIPSFLQKLPFTKTSHEKLAPLMPIVFESFSFDEYDVVISITSEAGKGILTKPNTIHLCYCLTPTRYLWSGYEEYFPKKIVRMLLSPAVSYLRWWDRIASTRPHSYIAISKEVQKRIKEYYNQDSLLIYPPVELPKSVLSSLPQEKGYYLIVSRLVPYKRIDLAIKACNKLGFPLKIIGRGSDEKRLRGMSGPTIEFLGSLTDEEVVGYYRQCKGFLFPGSEDFGITILEAQLLGKPVLAFRGGGALETIVEGKTGMFFDKQTVSSLVDALKKFDAITYDPKVLEKNAEKFSERRFLEEFKTTVENLVKKHI